MDTGASASQPLVSVRDLRVHFPITSGVLQRVTGHVKAVDGVSFDIPRGETFGLVGESGCGKSTTGRAILRLLEPTGGEVSFAGQEIRAKRPRDLRRLRRRMQIIFQDPYSSLSPRLTVGRILAEPLKLHGLGDAAQRQRRIEELLEMVGMGSEFRDRYPHELSGGQRQRVGIARALAVDPDFVVCDEPISALDVSIQAQVLNLLVDLREQLGLTYLFIAHDLSVVRRLSRRVGVMYLGKLVEVGAPSAVYGAPAHPYTRALLSAIPLPDPKAERERKRLPLVGDVPSAADPPPGCRFHRRCYLYEALGRPERCRVDDPAPRPAPAGQHAACHFFEQLEAFPPAVPSQGRAPTREAAAGNTYP